jgi:benzoylformate decarboxylase
VLNAERDLDLLAPTRVAPRIVGDRQAVERAAALLARAERPLIVAGHTVAKSGALAELTDLAELVGCPVMIECVSSTCSFPFTHPQYAGALPRLGPQIRGILMRHDVLLSIGADLFTLSLPDDVDPMPPGLDVIQLDVNAWELGKNYPAAVAIMGDAKATLPDLSEAFRRHTTKTGHRDAAHRREAARQAHDRMNAELADKARREAGQVPMSPLSLVQGLASATPADAIIVDESISSAAGVRNLFPCADAQSFYALRGGGIGWGLPAALGVKLAQPGRPVIALVGDGSAMYTNQALWTAAHEGLAVVYVIFNNVSYRILKQRTLALKGYSAEDDRYVGMDLVRPQIDFVGLARSLGVPGEQVEKAADVPAALDRGLRSGGPYLIDARIDPAFK